MTEGDEGLREIMGQPVTLPARRSDPKSGPVGPSLRILLIASAIAGVLIEMVVLGSDAWLRLSYVDVYHAIEMGMSYKQVQTLLEEQRIWCGFENAAPAGVRPQIRFSDYWRDYFIVFDPETGRNPGTLTSLHWFSHEGRLVLVPPRHSKGV